MSAKPIRTQLIIDVQLLQTSDRNRGMGLFLVGLLRNLELNDTFTITFVVNGRLHGLNPEDIKLAEQLKAQLVSVNLLHRGDNEEFAASASINCQRLNEALSGIIDAKSNAKVVYFIPALFSSEIHPVFPVGTANVLLFHDIIPFLYHENYFPDHEGLARKDYAQRFREFYKTDMFVTNSQTTADDLTVYFGVDSSRIVAILGAAAERGSLVASKPSIASKLENGFVLMPSGDDFRKNNALAVQAFAGFKSDLKLVITSNFSEGTKRALSEECANVVFPGSVSDEEFLWLLDNAKAVFFPTLYEGLGMPILEAVERSAVIACSNIPVFAEISQDAFLFFDPHSAASMTAALKKALATDKEAHSKRLQKAYQVITQAFSWPKTAHAFLHAIETVEPAAPAKKRLAVFCPSPSSYSAVGKYAFEVHAELSRLFEIDYYAEEGLTAFHPTRPNILEYAAGYYPAATFTLEKAKQYDHILYNLGNSEFHIDTIFNALRLPANAIVHDTRLNGIFDWLERQGFMPSARRQLEAGLDDAFQVHDTSCLVSLVTNQRVIYCHSGFAHTALKQFTPGLAPRVVQTVHPIGVPAIQLKRLGDPTVSFAGIISEDKGISMVSEIAKDNQVQVRVFGFGVLGDSPLLQNLGDNVRVMKDLSDKEFQDNLQQSDILVNYRPNYHGETSRSTLEAMRHGAAVIVKDVGWYGELPDDVVVKVSGEHAVIPAIQELIANPERRAKIASRARQFLQENYTYKAYAQSVSERLA